MKWTIAILLVAIFAVVLVAGAMSMTGGVVVETAKARRGDVRQYVDERGQTRLPETHLITMPFGARLEKIELNVGDKVTPEKYVARVVPTDLRDEVDEAEAAVARLEAAIAEKGDLKLEEGTLRQALLMVEAAVERIKASAARRDFAEDFLAKVRRLAQQGARTEEEADRAEVNKVEADVDYAEDNLTLQIIRILPEVVRSYIGDQELGKNTLEKEKSEAQARLRQVQTKQQRGTMFSPVAGVVLEKHVDNERYLPAGEVLLEIGEFERLEVEADILSQDVVAVEVGDGVEIYGPAIGAPLGEGVQGTVKKIYPAGFTKQSSLGVEEQRVKVIVDFAPGDLARLLDEQRLGVGYRVRVRIFTAEATDSITVPRSAVFRGAAGGWQVFVIRGGKARRVDITVGLMNDERVEILDGVNENEPVVLAPDTNLDDGARVQSIP